MANPQSDPEPFLQLVEGKSDLCGRFTDIRRLGNTGGGGQFSLVFTANDRETGRRVALKFLDPNITDPYRIESFAREVEVLGTLQNQPDILQRYSEMQEIIESFRHASGMNLRVTLKFYAMELASSDLGTILNGYNMDPGDKLILFRAMCRAVERIHRLGIVHRDIKPSNCLIMPDGTLRLSDFGTARCLNDTKGQLKRYAGPPGDWAYASLEMVAALHDLYPEVAYASDIYALGAVLFEMFTGTPLNLHLFSGPMVTDLNLLMNMVLPGDKVRAFNTSIASISNRHSLPDMRDFGSAVPRSIAPILNRMYGALATVDYRQRATDCRSAFLQINQCLVVLRNEAAYARWMGRKKARREAQDRKLSKPRPTVPNGAQP